MRKRKPSAEQESELEAEITMADFGIIESRLYDSKLSKLVEGK